MKSAFSPKQVLHWLDAVDADIESLQQQLAPLLAKRTRLEERRTLLGSLLSSFDIEPPKPAEGGRTSRVARPQREESIGQYVERRVIEILEEAGQPLHINEIHERFCAKGYRVPGAGKPVNLTSHIRLSKAIRSPVRGMYGTIDQVKETSKSPRARRKGRATTP